MKKILLILSQVLFLSVFVNTTWPEEIKIFGNEARPPKIWLEGGTPKGILVDILRYAEPELGIKFKIELYPMARAIKYSYDNNGGVIGFSKTEDRLRDFDYSDPVYTDDIILVVKKGREFKFEKIEDLREKTVVYQRGASYGPVFEEAKKVFVPVETNNSVSGLLFINAERADAIVISPGIKALQALLDDQLLVNLKNAFVPLPNPLAIDQNYLAFHKDMKMGDFIKRFNILIKKGKESGDINRIIEKYN